MLRHVVFFKFKAEASEAEIADLTRQLQQLPGRITEIRSFEVGRDLVRSERSFDLALISTFDDLAALQRYQVHPEHLPVVATVKQLCAGVAAVDFEI
ncbi:MAG: Dabb family protein [Desulfuromonadales bacterium]|nr:Dabb family protein [Desulfuromonadales bacterium]